MSNEDISKLLSLPKGVTVKRGSAITFCLVEEGRGLHATIYLGKQNRVQSVFCTENFAWDQIMMMMNEDQSWELLRKLHLLEPTIDPTSAYLEIAAMQIVQRWKFKAVFKDKGLSFQMWSHRLIETRAGTRAELEPYFKFSK